MDDGIVCGIRISFLLNSGKLIVFQNWQAGLWTSSLHIAALCLSYLSHEEKVEIDSIPDAR